MSATNDPDVRRFRLVAVHRFEDAQILMRNNHNTGAIYLAGYAVECALKWILLATISRNDRRDIMAEFRGNAGHNYEWLKSRYILAGGAAFPHKIIRAFSFVNVWSTDLRYDPKLRSPDEAELFLGNAEQILEWSKGR